VMNMLLIYLFASKKLEKGHKKDYLALVLKLCYHYDILRNRFHFISFLLSVHQIQTRWTPTGY
jgi:hypothetical protein